MEVVLQGQLKVEDRRRLVKRFKQYTCVLTQQSLRVYAKEGANATISIRINGSSLAIGRGEKSKHKFCFVLTDGSEKNGRGWRFAADDEKTLALWVREIRNCQKAEEEDLLYTSVFHITHRIEMLDNSDVVERFGLAKRELLIGHYYPSIEEDKYGAIKILTPGSLYITTEHLAFYSNIMNNIIRFCFRLEEIDNLDRISEDKLHIQVTPALSTTARFPFNNGLTEFTLGAFVDLDKFYIDFAKAKDIARDLSAVQQNAKRPRFDFVRPQSRMRAHMLDEEDERRQEHEAEELRAEQEKGKQEQEEVIAMNEKQEDFEDAIALIEENAESTYEYEREEDDQSRMDDETIGADAEESEDEHEYEPEEEEVAQGSLIEAVKEEQHQKEAEEENQSPISKKFAKLAGVDPSLSSASILSSSPPPPPESHGESSSSSPDLPELQRLSDRHLPSRDRVLHLRDRVQRYLSVAEGGGDESSSSSPFAKDDSDDALAQIPANVVGQTRSKFESSSHPSTPSAPYEPLPLPLPLLSRSNSSLQPKIEHFEQLLASSPPTPTAVAKPSPSPSSSSSSRRHDHHQNHNHTAASEQLKEERRAAKAAEDAYDYDTPLPSARRRTEYEQQYGSGATKPEDRGDLTHIFNRKVVIASAANASSAALLEDVDTDSSSDDNDDEYEERNRRRRAAMGMNDENNGRNDGNDDSSEREQEEYASSDRKSGGSQISSATASAANSPPITPRNSSSVDDGVDALRQQQQQLQPQVPQQQQQQQQQSVQQNQREPKATVKIQINDDRAAAESSIIDEFLRADKDSSSSSSASSSGQQPKRKVLSGRMSAPIFNHPIVSEPDTPAHNPPQNAAPMVSPRKSLRPSVRRPASAFSEMLEKGEIPHGGNPPLPSSQISVPVTADGVHDSIDFGSNRHHHRHVKSIDFNNNNNNGASSDDVIPSNLLRSSTPSPSIAAAANSNGSSSNNPSNIASSVSSSSSTRSSSPVSSSSSSATISFFVPSSSSSHPNHNNNAAPSLAQTLRASIISSAAAAIPPAAADSSSSSSVSSSSQSDLQWPSSLRNSSALSAATVTPVQQQQKRRMRPSSSLGHLISPSSPRGSSNNNGSDSSRSDDQDDASSFLGENYFYSRRFFDYLDEEYRDRCDTMHSTRFGSPIPPRELVVHRARCLCSSPSSSSSSSSSSPSTLPSIPGFIYFTTRCISFVQDRSSLGVRFSATTSSGAPLSPRSASPFPGSFSIGLAAALAEAELMQQQTRGPLHWLYSHFDISKVRIVRLSSVPPPESPSPSISPTPSTSFALCLNFSDGRVICVSSFESLMSSSSSSSSSGATPTPGASEQQQQLPQEQFEFSLIKYLLKSRFSFKLSKACRIIQKTFRSRAQFVPVSNHLRLRASSGSSSSILRLGAPSLLMATADHAVSTPGAPSTPAKTLDSQMNASFAAGNISNSNSSVAPSPVPPSVVSLSPPPSPSPSPSVLKQSSPPLLIQQQHRRGLFTGSGSNDSSPVTSPRTPRYPQPSSLPPSASVHTFVAAAAAASSSPQLDLSESNADVIQLNSSSSSATGPSLLSASLLASNNSSTIGVEEKDAASEASMDILGDADQSIDERIQMSVAQDTSKYAAATGHKRQMLIKTIIEKVDPQSIVLRKWMVERIGFLGWKSSVKIVVFKSAAQQSNVPFVCIEDDEEVLLLRPASSILDIEHSPTPKLANRLVLTFETKDMWILTCHDHKDMLRFFSELMWSN